MGSFCDVVWLFVMLFLGFLVFFVRVGILRGLEGLGLGILCVGMVN